MPTRVRRRAGLEPRVEHHGDVLGLLLTEHLVEHVGEAEGGIGGDAGAGGEAPDGKKGWVYKDWVTIPSTLDTSTICSIPVEELPPTPKTSQKDQKTPQSGEECVPTYYVSCP